ncbi:MAG TPA: penicillin-binding transpeptidase domain-containing protein, partial [Acidobacteriaceae bacterium]|nr:penicillin-binding transpeptidase domain-containing protein [Acidobacteriaceae bacterium]
MTLIDAFAQSRNIPALRIADKVGIRKVIEVAHRFGVTSEIPAFLPVAIGSADLTLAEQVSSYSVFPNDGIRITPHYIRRVVSPDGSPLQDRAPEVREVISVDIAREMMLLLQAVVQHGTAASAASMNHAFGGKTGTTNDYTDAWFIGFSPSITAGTWIGFDDRRSLGEKETGARAALPIWMDFMKVAVADRPNEQFSRGNAPKKKLEVAVTPPDQRPAATAPAAESSDADDSAEIPPPPPPQSAIPPPAPVNQPLPNDEPAPAPGPQLPAPRRPTVVPQKPNTEQQN